MKKHLLLPILLLVSVLVWAGLGAYLKYSLFPVLEMETGKNIISLPFVLIADDEMSFRFSHRLDAYQNPTEPPEPTEITEDPVQTDPPETTVPTQAAETAPIQTEPTEPAYVPVDESWFDDALFIGDSRTKGLKKNGRLGNADYFTEVNLAVYGVMNIKLSDQNFQNQSLESLLSGKTYGKIYIHFGINECGGFPDEFAAQYQALIEMIRGKQPEAYIILQSIMPVTSWYTGEEKYLPENLARFNEQIQGLVTDDRIRYIDLSQWCADEEGFLRGELTNDGCHPHGEGARQWAQWLKENAGWLGIP